MIGRVIQGRYRLTRLVGEGGFGTVYQAEDTKFGRDIAIKLLSPAANKNPEHARRFIDEAKVTSQLSHRNIPVVYDFGEAESGQLFIVTELFTGSALEDILEQGMMTPRQASWVASEVNEALVVAHHGKITHRDVKPPNIFIHRGSSGEEVKLLDFGIAKLSNQKSHTLTGQLFGTPYFMSPEQILGHKAITPAADIYSLGAVLFYCLTNTVPFDGDSQFVIFNKHVNSATPLLRERVPYLNNPHLQQLIDHLMEKRPEDRPQNAYEARDLFAQIEVLTYQLDQRSRGSLLSIINGSNLRDATTQAVPTASLESTEVSSEPNGERSSTPPQSIMRSTTSISELSEELTLPPLEEAWRPTARLELSHLTDALADEDDTTDNLVRRERSTHIHTPAIEEATTQLSSPPQPGEGVTGAVKSQTKIIALNTKTEDRLPLWRTRKMVAIFVFLGGVTLSSVFSSDYSFTPVTHDAQTAMPQQSSLSLGQVASQEQVLEDMSIEVALPLPTLAPPTREALNDDLELPKAPKKPRKRQLSRRSKAGTKTRSSRRQKVKSRSKKRLDRREKKTRKSTSRAKAPRQPSSSKKTQHTRHHTPTTPPLVKRVLLSVTPTRASYLPDTTVRLKSHALDLQGKRIPAVISFEVSVDKKRWRTVRSTVLKLTQSGSWRVRACVKSSTLCSAITSFVVYDPSEFIDLED